MYCFFKLRIFFLCIYIFIYIYAFSRRFYPKRLTIAFRLYIFNQYLCILWESNPQPFALVTQCSTTEPQEQEMHFILIYLGKNSIVHLSVIIHNIKIIISIVRIWISVHP